MVWYGMNELMRKVDLWEVAMRWIWEEKEESKEDWKELSENQQTNKQTKNNVKVQMGAGFGGLSKNANINSVKCYSSIF